MSLILVGSFLHKINNFEAEYLRDHAGFDFLKFMNRLLRNFSPLCISYLNEKNCFILIMESL